MLANTIAAFQKTLVSHTLFTNDQEKCSGCSFARIFENALEAGQEKNFAPSSSLLAPVLLTILACSS
jgi:hypothetical protein